MRKAIVVIVVLLMSVFLLGVPAWATLIDPATLQIGNDATIPSGSDPNPIYGNSFNIYQNQGGVNATINDPLALLLAVPLFGTSADTNLFDANSISSALINNATPLNVSVGSSFGTMSTASAYQTTMTNSDLYTVIGLGAYANNSMSFVNFTTSPFPGGATNPDAGATGFAIYAFSLYDSGTNLGAKDMVNITMSNIPIGTFIAGYGENEQLAFSTPFTQAGFVTPPPPVPEPGTFLLFGAGLTGLGLMRRWLRR